MVNWHIVDFSDFTEDLGVSVAFFARLTWIVQDYLFLLRVVGNDGPGRRYVERQIAMVDRHVA